MEEKYKKMAGLQHQVIQKQERIIAILEKNIKKSYLNFIISFIFGLSIGLALVTILTWK